MKKTLSLFLALCTLSALLLTSCAEDKDTVSDDNAAADTTVQDAAETTGEPEFVYEYKEDYDGEEFTILNYESIWNCYVHLDFEEQTGEQLDDAVYNRNRYVEEMLNFDLNVIRQTYTHTTVLIEMVTKAVMAGEDAYDAAYLPVAYTPSVLTGGNLYDLNSIPELQLTEDWWDHSLNDAVVMNGKLFTASSPLHFMSLDLAWVLLFNHNIFDDYGMEYPYDHVRNGTWTLDTFGEYVAAAASLNGDESWSYTDDGNSVYGVMAHDGSPFALSYASGNRVFTKNADDSYSVTFDTERTYAAMEKIISILNPKNGQAHINNSTNAAGFYITGFKEGRSAFLSCEVKAALEERDMDDTFGLLPNPKYDEDQEDYYSNTTYGTCWLTVPTTQTDTAMAGTILDALAYESWDDVLEIYYDITVSQKGLRNDDSIEMLDIVRSTRGIELSMVIGVAMDYYSNISRMAKNNDNTMASYTASVKDAFSQKFDAFIAELG